VSGVGKRDARRRLEELLEHGVDVDGLGRRETELPRRVRVADRDHFHRQSAAHGVGDAVARQQQCVQAARGAVATLRRTDEARMVQIELMAGPALAPAVIVLVRQRQRGRRALLDAEAPDGIADRHERVAGEDDREQTRLTYQRRRQSANAPRADPADARCG